MSHNRHAKKVDSSQAEVVDTLRKAGYVVEIIHQPVDLLIKYETNRNRWFLMECKPPGWKKWSKAQAKQEKFCIEHEVFVVRSGEEALRAVRLI